MRLIVFAFIAGVLAFMGWIWLQPVCKGGTVVATEAACLAAPGFDAAFCRRAFARTAEVARNSGTAYPTLWECNQHWPGCIERGATGEAVPAPSAWCIVRGAGGAIARLEPQYDNRRQ